MCCCVFFFFQAEDGIRDLVRSRGLGDVYKRQTLTGAELVVSQFMETSFKNACLRDTRVLRSILFLSLYTHLTLPTSDLV